MWKRIPCQSSSRYVDEAEFEESALEKDAIKNLIAEHLPEKLVRSN